MANFPAVILPISLTSGAFKEKRAGSWGEERQQITNEILWVKRLKKTHRGALDTGNESHLWPVLTKSTHSATRALEPIKAAF